MSGRVTTKRPLIYVVAAGVLVTLAVFFGGKVYRLAGTFREVHAVVDRLPDLPTIRSGTVSRQRGFPAVWAHRVNSTERAVLLAPTYKGMEIDVIYDAAADDFDVGHPPTPSAGISLETMLGSIPGVRAHYFWLDFKNLTEVNEAAACARLATIGRKYDIVDRVIVESTNPRALTCFTDSGFYTSYYLFPDSQLSTMTAAHVAEYYAEVKANLLASKVNALSATYRALPFIEKYFPDTDVLVWYLDAGTGVRYHAWVTYLRLKTRVKVILVSQPSAGYR